MFDRWFLRIYGFIEERKALVTAILGLLIIAAGIGLFFTSFDGSFELMLPDDETIRSNINFFSDSNLGNKIVISLALISEDKDSSDLFRAADDFKTSLASPLFTEVTTGITGDGMMDEMFFSNYVPNVITEQDLLYIDSQINSESISQKLRWIYRQMLKPASIFMSSMIYSDPLGLRLLVLEKLNTLKSFTGYELNIKDGHFISRDGRHTMIITQTSVAVADGFGAREMVNVLNKSLSSLPDYISADVVGGHFHTLSNEKVIKSDIRLVIIIASIGFLLLFLIAFRDIRAVYIFIIPSVAVIIAINLSGLIAGSLSFWVIGLGTVIAGISVDYGTHVYVAVRNHGRAAEVVNSIAKPVCIGALTTLGIFFAFFFSQTRGYHQLAMLSVLSILLSLAAALFILPHMLRAKEFPIKDMAGPGIKVNRAGTADRLVAVLWVASIIAASVLSAYVGFDSNIQQLDGSEPAVFEAEENFHNVWGRQDNQAIFVVKGKTYEETLEENDRLYEDAVRAIGAENITSLSILWPSQKTRQRKVGQWRDFWKQDREAGLRELLKAEGSKLQFSEEAFKPFFDNLYNDMPGTEEVGRGNMPNIFKENFVQERDGGYQILSFFPDEQQYIDIMSGLSSQLPGSFIVSRRVLSEAISRSTSAEGKLLAAISAVFIIMLTFLFIKDVKRSLIALTPVLTSILWLLGTMSILGYKMNVANLFAGIVVMGLCIDYGIFMTYKYEHNLRKSVIIAISISAVTTLIGAGVLLFARHPALFSSGLTLFIGVLAGYISAVFIIPPLEKVFSVSVE